MQFILDLPYVWVFYNLVLEILFPLLLRRKDCRHLRPLAFLMDDDNLEKISFKNQSFRSRLTPAECQINIKHQVFDQ